MATIMKTHDAQVEAVRRFSRFYTKQIGLLEEGLLESPYSLTEGRVIYELAHQDDATATTIAAALALDPGYLSRILRSLGRRGLIDKRRSDEDRRVVFLTLSDRGRGAFERLDASSRGQIGTILSRLGEPDRKRVVDAMGTVERLLSEGEPNADTSPRDRPPFTLRPHRAGDVGWVVERHGALYAESHGWDAGFEALCAEIGSRFLRKFDPHWERSWIAERDGERVGAVFLVRRSKTTGQLRFLFVDPAARGLGLGARLVSECVGHARHVGYAKMTLFTVQGLDSARKLYEAEGFRLAHESPGEGWAEGCVEQQWDLEL
jgi:DNA-binding MarR family transcriptional regulator/N-acetylglutamate synthase-like GNAT family acetyltransferase